MIRAEAWLSAHGFEVTPETGLEELRMPIDLAFAASGATGAGHSKESIAMLTAGFGVGWAMQAFRPGLATPHILTAAFAGQGGPVG